MGKRMLADVLWEAANRHLATEPRESGHANSIHKWSCWSVARAMGAECELNEGMGAAGHFLTKLGLDTKPGNVLDALPYRQQQPARYMWLLLAMHVAADEGIEL